METIQSTQLAQYRQALYDSFDHAADATFELLDALASQTNARSVAELSLEPVFRREYSSLYGAITDFLKVEEASAAGQPQRKQEVAQLHLLGPYVPPGGRRRHPAERLRLPRPFRRGRDLGQPNQPQVQHLSGRMLAGSGGEHQPSAGGPPVR